MNTQREVFNKLFKEEKVELATQKIELANVNDLKNAVSSAKKEVSSLIKLNDKLEQAIVNANKIRVSLKAKNSSANGVLNAIKKDYNDVKTKAKDLGLSISDIPQAKETNQWIDELESVIDTIEDLTRQNIG